MKKNLWQHIKKLDNHPNYVNLDSFILYAIANDSELKFTDFTPNDEELDVYALQFGSDLYIGSSNEIRRRVNAHYRTLKNKEHFSPKVQSAYDKSKSFRVYVLMRCSINEKCAEQMIIRLLQPSLNTIAPFGRNERFNDIIWQRMNQI